jgi:hypothetical protein
MLRDQRNPIARLNLDDAIHTLRSPQCRVVCAVAGTVHGFRAPVGGPQKCIIPTEGDAINPATQVNFSSLPQSPTEILEGSVSRHVGSDEKEIVVIGRSEPPGAAIQMAFALAASDAAGASRSG